MPAVEPAVVARALYDSVQATLKDQGAQLREGKFCNRAPERVYRIG